VGIVIERQLNTRTIATGLSLLALIEFVLVGVVLGNAGWPVVGVVVAGLATLVVLGCALMSWRVVVRVVRNDHGASDLDIVYGVVPHITQRFASPSIEAARVDEINAWRSGGIGYRGSLRILKKAALNTRSGPALVLSLSGSRTFLVTVDDPQDFVDALGVASSEPQP